MSKPRLTATVLSGLSMMAGLIEAGGCGDALGIEESNLDREGKKNWREIERACEWIRSMQAAKRTEKDTP